MSTDEIIKVLEDRLEDYRSRYFANKGLHLDARADELVFVLKIIKAENS